MDGKIKAMPPLVVFVFFDQWVMALSLEGPAGAFWEFTNDINAICAIQHCFRAARYRPKLDGKGKAWLSGACI